MTGLKRNVSHAPAISLVVVCFYSSADLPRLILSFRKQAVSLGLSFEVVVVDHSENPEEAQRLRSLPIDFLLLRPNRGYAAGVNEGIRHCSAPIVVVANADVCLHEGALTKLLDALKSFPIVGPQFTLGRWLYPPADLQIPLFEVYRVLASRHRFLQRSLVFREIQRYRSVWEATGPVRQMFLSGSLLVFDTSVFQRVGTWDESFFLYYEETDWLLRARRMGFFCALVPQAQVEHSWGRSATPQKYSDTFLASRRKYYQKHFGPLGKLVAKLPTRLLLSPASVVPPQLPVEEHALWLLSPSLLGLPAFGYYNGPTFPIAEAVAAFSSRPNLKQFIVNALTINTERLFGPWSWYVHT